MRQVLIASLAACLGLSGVRAEESPADPRVVELLRQECVTSTGRRDITLFANGTVRVREVGPNAPGLLLGELGPVELEGFRRRLAELDLSETDRRESVVGGALVERCRLELHRDGRPTESFDYGRFGSHSLALAAALKIAEDLAAIARPETARASLPRGYVPEAGDLLVRTDGERFAVVGLTGDGKGVELAGVRLPLVLYVAIADLDREFVALERRNAQK